MTDFREETPTPPEEQPVEDVVAEANTAATFESAVANNESQTTVYQTADPVTESTSGVQREGKAAPSTEFSTSVENVGEGYGSGGY